MATSKLIHNKPSNTQVKTVPLFSRLGTVALIIGMVIAFFLSQLVGIYSVGKLFFSADKGLNIGDIFYLSSSNGTIVSLSIMISCLLLASMSMLIIRLNGGSVRKYLAIKPFSLSVGIALFAVLLLFMIGSQALTYWLDKAPSAFVDPLYQSVSSVWLLVVAIVIVAPLYEELIFRGILWSAIAEQLAVKHSETTGAIIASIVTSLIFAVIHLQYGIYEISTITVLALIFCYARFKSGSILLPIILHILNNGAAMWLYLSQVN